MLNSALYILVSLTPSVFLCVFWRISGDTALDKNIHESVSAQIKKNFAKSKWKVSVYLQGLSFTEIFLVLALQLKV